MAIDEQAKLLEFSRILKERGVDPELFNQMWKEQEAFEGMGGTGWYFENNEEVIDQPPPGGADPAGGGLGNPMPNLGPNAFENQPPDDMPDLDRVRMGLGPKQDPNEAIFPKPEDPAAPPNVPPPTPEPQVPAQQHEPIGNMQGFFENKEARGKLNEPLFTPWREGQAMPDHTFRDELRNRNDGSRQESDTKALKKDAEQRRRRYRRFK